MTRPRRAFALGSLRPSYRRAWARHVQPDEIVRWRADNSASAGIGGMERMF